jgi:hypothetical protein
MARHTTTNDYGTTANTPNKMLRSLILANHVLHWISALIVMSIAAYFIADFWSNVHLRYWVAVVSVHHPINRSNSFCIQFLREDSHLCLPFRRVLYPRQA